MNDWLHFVGKSYYGIKEFIEEATTIGVSRRVAVKVATKMEFGDWIYLAQKTDRGCEIFGRFQISAVSLDKQALDMIRSLIPLRQISNDPRKVSRGCGTYSVVATYAVDMKLSEMAALLDSMDIKATMLIGCSKDEIYFFNKPYPVLKNTPFRQGFRLFDGMAFMKEWQEEQAARAEKKIKAVRLNSQYYADHIAPPGAPKISMLQSLIDYNKYETTTELPVQMPLFTQN